MTTQQQKYFRIGFTALSIAIFISSLFFACYYTGREDGVYPLLPLLMGWMGLAMGSFACIAWFANPVLIMAWIMSGANTKVSLAASVASFFIATSFLFFDGVIGDEAGHIRKITAYGAGYWLWLLSIGVMVAGNAVLFFKKRKQHL